jgi:hypothetical protein
MGEVQIFQIGKEIARFLVLTCESEQYVSLMEQFREAKTRQMLIEVIYRFLYLGELIKIQHKQLEISPTKWSTLLQFIEKGKIPDVRKLHISMVGNVAMLEVNKVQKMERYLDQLKEKMKK